MNTTHSHAQVTALPDLVEFPLEDRLMAGFPRISAGPDVPPQILFMEINQLITEQWLAPEVRAALFRALPAIKDITVAQDVAVADGRRGVAFSLDDDGARQSLVLDPQTFRYLGTNSTRLQDRTCEWADGSKETFKAGTVNLTAQLEAMIVDQPGQRS